MDTLFLHPDGQGQADAWGREAGALKALGMQSLSALAERYAGSRVVLFVPSSECLFTRVTISARQRRQAADALGWLIEDQVGEDVENLQVIAGPEQGDGDTPLLAMATESVERWMALCRDAGWSLQALLPDVLLLPHAEGAWSLQAWPNARIALRTDLLSGAVLEDLSALQILDAAWQEFVVTPEGHRPDALRVFNDPDSDTDRTTLQAWADSCELPVEFLSAPDMSELLLTTVDWSRHPGNLLQGRFASRRQLLLPSALRVAAMFLLVAFALQLVNEWGRLAHYKHQATKTQATATALYKELFPNDRRIVSIRRQMEAHLETGGSSGGALPVLTQIAEAIQGSGLATQRVDFSGNEFTVDVEARSLGDIDALKQKLDSQGLQTEIVSANAQNGAIRGRLRVGSGA